MSHDPALEIYRSRHSTHAERRAAALAEHRAGIPTATKARLVFLAAALFLIWHDAWTVDGVALALGAVWALAIWGVPKLIDAHQREVEYRAVAERHRLRRARETALANGLAWIDLDGTAHNMIGDPDLEVGR